MHYGLSSNSFSVIFLQAIEGDRAARIFLRLACFTTFAALNTPSSRTGQFVLSKEQLEQLSTDNSFNSFIESLGIDYSNVAKLEIGEVDAHTPDTASLRLPEKVISQNTLFTTPTWLGDLGSGCYGPSIRFGDLIAAWRSEGLPLSQLTGIVSLIDPDNGKGLLNESHIINGIGLKGSANPSDPSLPGSHVSLVKPDEWFSLAQFGAVLQTTAAFEDVERLTDSLVKNDFTIYSDEHAYLFIADVIVDGKTWIRREFSPSTYREMPETPFSLAKDSKQYVEEIPSGTPLTVIGKIHPKAEAGFGGKLDTNVHIHGLSPQLLDLLFREDSEQLYDHLDEFLRVDTLLASLSLSEQLYCGHLKTESGQCFFKSVEKVHAIQPLSNVIEISKTGAPAHDLSKGKPVESQMKLVVAHSNIWSSEQKKPAQTSTNLLDSQNVPGSSFN